MPAKALVNSRSDNIKADNKKKKKKNRRVEKKQIFLPGTAVFCHQWAATSKKKNNVIEITPSQTHKNEKKQNPRMTRANQFNKKATTTISLLLMIVCLVTHD